MDIKKYLDLQKTRNNFRIALQAHLKSNATTLLRKYEKLVLTEIANSDGDVFGAFNLKATIDNFSSELITVIEAQKENSVENLTKLWEDSKASLDVNYKTDYLVLPKAQIDNYKVLSEVDAIINKYRNNDITELRMKRMIQSRLRATAHVANTIAKRV